MKKGFALLCLLALLLPLPGLIINRPDILREDREEQINAALGFRGKIAAAHAAVEGLLGMSGSDRVTLGRAGTLFLSETLSEAVGAETMDDKAVEAVAQSLAALDEELKEKGAYLIFLCAPSKANIVADALPYYAAPRTGESALDKLQSRLAELGVRYVDVKAMALEQPDAAYLRTDTHWRDGFACRVYQALMAQLPPAARHDYDDAQVEETQYRGDLTALIYPDGGPQEDISQRVIPRAYRVQGVMRTVMDLRIETACDTNSLRVIMLRDSFANALFPYLANNVGALTLIRDSAWQDGYWQPDTDAVILEIAERSLPLLAMGADE